MKTAAPSPAKIERERQRSDRFLPEGKPRYVHIYDNGGKTADRYTVVFTGRYAKRFDYPAGYTLVLGMNSYPFHPQGIGMTSEYDRRIDWPTYGHLGKKIKFDALPEDCQRATFDIYLDVWQLAARIEPSLEGAHLRREDRQLRASFDKSRIAPQKRS